jgi:hypothetical protein
MKLPLMNMTPVVRSELKNAMEVQQNASDLKMLQKCDLLAR